MRPALRGVKQGRLCAAAGSGYRPVRSCWRLPVHRRTLLRAAASLSVLAGLAGCTVGPNFSAPKPDWNPVTWFGGHQAPPPKEMISEPVEKPIDPQWWTVFHDPELTTLEQRVAAANLDVRTASIRLAESRASFGVARADLFPNLDANGNYTRQKIAREGALALFPVPGGPSTASSQTGGAGAGGLPNTPQAGTPGTGSNGLGATSGAAPNLGQIFQPFNLYQYGFDSSWELDLWGRVRRNIEGAKASLQAAAEAERDTLLTSLAEMARDYVQLRGVQRQIEITERNLRIAQQSLDLTRQRAAGGVTTDLDVANAAAQVETTASQLPNLRAQEIEVINAIAFLLGQPPRAMQAELSVVHPIPPVPPKVPVGLPSELARRRPDIRQAEQQLHTATADVGVAVADFYPRVTLSGSVAMQAIAVRYLGSWYNASTYSFGPSVSLPIFEGGRLRRTLELRKGQQTEAAIAYQRTVLNALHEVDDALTAYTAEQQRRNRLERAVVENRRAVRLAQDRYAQGVADFLSVLTAEQNLLGAEQQLTDSTTTVSTDLVQIYKTLGGGWESALPDKPEQPEDGGSFLDNLL
jgi:NodT family efflux transporter outer membrane factor (OMF) lipoprotein